MSNHVHLLLHTGRTQIAAIIRRLLTGYAVSFNRRHCRSVSEARKNLQWQAVKWSRKDRCPDLIDGGLIRSAGGWSAVKEAYREGNRLFSDERLH